MNFISLDPGGTKCEAVLCNEKAEILTYCNLVPKDTEEIQKTAEIDPRTLKIGFGRSNAIITKALKHLLQYSDLNKNTYILTSSMQYEVKKIAASLNPNLEVLEFMNEFSYALSCELKDKAYMALAGTGALCRCGTIEDNVEIDGLGPNLGDQGGGAYIGLKAIKAVAKSEWHPDFATSLSKRINNYFLDSDTNNMGKSLVPYFFESPQRTILASLSKIVNEEAEKGDRIATEILQDSGKALAETFRCLLYQYKSPDKYNLPVICTGSILVHSDIYFNTFKNEVKKIMPDSEVNRISVPPCYGGIIQLAKIYSDTDINIYYQKLKENISKIK